MCGRAHVKTVRCVKELKMVVSGWLTGRAAVLGHLGGWRAALQAQERERPLCRATWAGADASECGARGT